MSSLVLTNNAIFVVGSKLDRLEARLQAQLGGRIRGLNVLLSGKGLILRGFARTYYAKQLAQHTVMGEVDLPIVANEIEVS